MLLSINKIDETSLAKPKLSCGRLLLLSDNLWCLFERFLYYNILVKKNPILLYRKIPNDKIWRSSWNLVDMLIVIVIIAIVVFVAVVYMKHQCVGFRGALSTTGAEPLGLRVRFRNHISWIIFPRTLELNHIPRMVSRSVFISSLRKKCIVTWR